MKLLVDSLDPTGPFGLTMTVEETRRRYKPLGNSGWANALDEFERVFGGVFPCLILPVVSLQMARPASLPKFLQIFER